LECPLKILFVDDEPFDVLFEQRELKRAGVEFACRTASSEAELNHELTEFEPDVILCDYTMPGFSGPQALSTVRRLRPMIPVLMVSGSIADDEAIDCLGHGATDYLLKSNLGRLAPAVRRAVADARERETLEARIDQLANFDPLTGLPNLACITQDINRCFDRARSENRLAALIVLNLDEFHRLCETCGRRDADKVLRDISAMLRTHSRGCEHVARTGPNEFMLVISDVGDPQQAGALVQGLLNSISGPPIADGREVRLSATAGIALCPTDGADLESLLFKATAALHEAKRISRGGLQFHSGDAVQHAYETRRLESALRDAVEGEKLALYYQPQFDIKSGQVCGVEALARWFRDGATPIAPSVFIPLAENTGLIAALGRWALREGCKMAAKQNRSATAGPAISINVSPRQICEEFTAEIARVLKNSGLAAECLELEITESVLVSNIDRTFDCMNHWKSLGVRIALDDFGTGYSSLGYLAKLPIDRLKIDSSLIRGMTTGSKDTTIVRSVVALGRDLGITVIAEGVETEEQLGILGDLGCEQAQGYLLMAPTTASKAWELMGRRWGARPSGLVERAGGLS